MSNVEKLTAWLLRGTKGMGMADVRHYKESGDTKTIRLKRAVPLKMVYLTAWATADGVVQFRRDLYNRDGVGRQASY